MREPKQITQTQLKKRLSYDDKTGIFTRLETRGCKLAGSVAGNVDKHGYCRIVVDGKRFRAHHLAWLYVNGEWPDGELDHRNRDKRDNRIANLRLSTRHQNMANCGVRSDSSVGLRGVGRTKCGYRASIRHKGRARHIGVFKTAEEAHAAYMEANRDLHGEFASC